MKASRSLVSVLLVSLAALFVGGCSDYNDDNVVLVRRQSTPLQVNLAQAATSASAGWAHTCAILADGSMNCWGGNLYGQLGNGGASVSCVDGYSVCSNGPVAVSGTTQWASVAGGYLFTCAIDNAQVAHCWGAGRRGQLGDGQQVGSAVPTTVSGGLSFSQLSGAMGGDLACGISGNALYCWGTGYYGQPGTGAVNQLNSTPYQVSPAQSFGAVSVGLFHTCALDTTSAAWCWGANDLGQVGDATDVDRLVPTVVLGGRTYTQIVTGLGHTCALDGTGVAFCWGAAGQIGRTPASFADQATPAAVSGAQTFVRLAAGAWHTCGLDAGGALWCWGDNSYSQFGDGGTTSSQLPRQIAGLPAFTQLVAGGAHTCGLTAAGAMFCWGANTYGQSGRLP